MSDPQTFWLNVTNAAMALAVMACFLTVLVAAIRDVVGRCRRRLRLYVALAAVARDPATRWVLDAARTDPSARLR